MAGGSGERFWPLSRASRPKQLLSLDGSGRSMIEQAVSRISPLVAEDGVYIATAPQLVDPIRAAIPDRAILAEPCKRDTAGCMVWLAANLLAADPSARETVSMAVVASDHFITPVSEFHATVGRIWDHVEATGALGTIGIPPTRPETGYGYIETGTDLGNGIFEVKRFREKPDLPTAEVFLASGNFLWNSGMFFWKLDSFMAQLERSQPELATGVFEIAARLRELRSDDAAERFAQLPKISVDYAVMESAEQVAVAPATFDWDDAGSWDALDRFMPAGESGNVALGGAVLHEANDSVVYVEGGPLVAAIGVRGLVIVSTPDAVLVMPKERAQDVKKILESLRDSRSDLL
ncbi:MAG: Mannose-1-phosphate guanylyltransferase RfbM [Fimbriimonadaceae bacterium]|nr:Mannose-1-phosphate guanylyltransferase RfbM [Fimbriimonadaceae bacterium]